MNPLSMPSLQALLTLHPFLMGEAGTSVKIYNEPFMPLSVENIGIGPRGLPALSVAHYGECNGDLMRDPEMCFEMDTDGQTVREFHPFYFRNDYVGLEQFSVIYMGNDPDDKPTSRVDTLMVTGQRDFAATWDRNLAAQGFVAAFEKSREASSR